MAILKKRTLQSAACCAVVVSLCCATAASAALIRDFENSTPPAGDQYMPSSGGPPVVPGAKWSPGGAPGSAMGQMDNTNSPGYGSSNPSLSGMYNGVYRINGNNLISELGTSLSAFTLTYAYKPGGQAPNVNLSSSNFETRQFRLWEFNTGATKLDVIMTGGTSGAPGTRPSLRLNGSVVSGLQTEGATFSRRLTDGDPNTYVNPTGSGGGGTFNAANSEWVFYAVTYSIPIGSPNSVQVDEYAMTLFGSGLQQNSNGLRKYTSTLTNGLVAGSNIINLTTNTRLDFGSAAFGGNGNRPYDGYFDMLKMYPSVLSFEQLQTLATRAFVAVPEPSSAMLLVGVLFGLVAAPRRGRAA